MASFSLSLLLLSYAAADPAGVTTSQHSVKENVELPVLIAQAVLHYPEAAYPEQLHGTVALTVHISKDGLVETVRVESGLEIFHEEAKTAAKRLKFNPARRDGVAIPFDTQVVFHFPPPHIEPNEDVYHPDHSIVVSSDSLHNQTAHVEEVFTEEELEQERQMDLARTLEGVAGVEFASGSANTSKPLIRGQTERRLLIIRDGIPHASQKWGVDHAPEIDVFDVGTIRVRKGAEAVRYGGDAIGGVILINSPDLRVTDGVGGKTVVGAASNGLKGFGMGRVDLSQDQWSGRVQGNWTNSMDIQTPTYLLGNTASNTWNVGGVAQHASKRNLITVRLAHHHNYSVSLRNESRVTRRFRDGFDIRTSTYCRWMDPIAISKKPYQDVDHTKEALSGSLNRLGGQFRFNMPFKETSQRAEPSRIRMLNLKKFLLRTHSTKICRLYRLDDWCSNWHAMGCLC